MNASSAAECKPRSRKRARRNQRSPKKILETGPRTPEGGSKEIESTISERDAKASTCIIYFLNICHISKQDNVMLVTEARAATLSELWRMSSLTVSEFRVRFPAEAERQFCFKSNNFVKLC